MDNDTGCSNSVLTVILRTVERWAVVKTTTTSLMLSALFVSDYTDSKDNSKLAARYGVRKDALPAFRLFLRGDLHNPHCLQRPCYSCKYSNLARTGGWYLKYFVWIYLECTENVFAGVAGVFAALPGTLPSLDIIARRYSAQNLNTKLRFEMIAAAEIVQKRFTLKQDIDDAEIYLKAMRRCAGV